MARWCAGVLLGIAIVALAGDPAHTQPGGTPLIAVAEAKWTGDLGGMVERRMVRVLVPYSKTYFFIDRGRQRGTTVELMNEFEKSLRKTFETDKRNPIRIIMIPTRREDLFGKLVAGEGDLAMGNLTVTAERSQSVDFSTPLLKGVREILVTRSGEPEVVNEDGLAGRTIHVRRSSSFHQSLAGLNQRLAQRGLKPVEIAFADEGLETEDLLDMVHAGLLPATIADDHVANVWAQILKGLKLHRVSVRENAEIAIAFRKDSPRLAEALNAFVASHKDTVFGHSLFNRYFKSVKWAREAISPAEKAKFESYRSIFQKFGEQYQVDWLLLAAQGYQESTLNQALRNPSGAVGIMQVKPATARAHPIKIPSISTAHDNIHAGAKYGRYLADQYFPALAHDPLNRTLFAMASYNAGPNRIAKLRAKAAQRNLDPDKWFNNVEWLVAEDAGLGPVTYVANIFKYYIAYQHAEGLIKARNAPPN